MYLADIFTVHANIAGVPALNIPFGEDTNGMPIGVQIMANMHEDALLLSLAEELA
jgi:aspartyl-tRNA(Asn)/glutamyl-tRNA(Gln) amidotransferase subunit A